MAKVNYSKIMKEQQKKKRKKEKFITARMWFATIISKFHPDRETIPKNIGNNLLILNNMYVTKKGLSAIVGSCEYTDDTPVAFISDMIRHIKDRCSGVVVDVKIKSFRHQVDLQDKGLQNRIKLWEAMLDNPLTRTSYAKRAARCLYTVEVARAKEPMYKSRIFVILRAQKGSQLKQAVDLATGYLQGIGASTKYIKSNMQQILEYCCKISSSNGKNVQDIPYVLTSNETLAEMLPSTQDINDPTGVNMGMDVELHENYLINFRKSANAKNIYVAADSGSGKTMLVQNYALDMFLDDYCQAFMDIKGTEFGAMTKAMGGIVISMTRASTEYINSFVWDIKDVLGEDYDAYANEQIRRAKERMLIIANFPEEYVSTGESLVERFLQSMYVTIGASTTNPNTWYRTHELEPGKVWHYFKSYLSREVRERYGEVADICEKNLEPYYSPEGSNHSMFTTPFRIEELLVSNVICFDFGLIKENGSQTPVQYKLHLEDMQYILDKFIARKKKEKRWTHLILEESQIIPGFMGRVYSHYLTLGRSMNLVTSMLGNSVSAVYEDPELRKGVENINIFIMGKLPSTSHETLVGEFGMSEVDFAKLQLIQQGGDLEHAFLLINRMQSHSTSSVLRAELPREAVESSLFKVVDTVNEEDE